MLVFIFAKLCWIGCLISRSVTCDSTENGVNITFACWEDSNNMLFVCCLLCHDQSFQLFYFSIFLQCQRKKKFNVEMYEIKKEYVFKIFTPSWLTFINQNHAHFSIHVKFKWEKLRILASILLFKLCTTPDWLVPYAISCFPDWQRFSQLIALSKSN